MEVSNEENGGENKAGGNPKDFGKVVDALHNKQALPSLRTYQGDMAEFIKSKNESVISIAVKEKERKEERQEEKKKVEEKKIQTGEIKIAPKPKKGRFKENFTMIVLSLLLLAGGFVGVLYVSELLKTGPAPEVALENAVIPYNQSVTLAAVTKENFRSELSKLIPESGVTLVKVSGQDGMPIQKAKDLFSFLEISLPFTLSRTMRDDYAIGTLYQNSQASSFIILTVNDFGGAFAGMLDWEDAMENDLSFLNTEFQKDMTSLLATTTTPAKPGTFVWRDIIVKNKDTRGLVNEKGRSKVAYTFLDKNTVLIIGDIQVIGEISSIYASRSVAR